LRGRSEKFSGTPPEREDFLIFKRANVSDTDWKKGWGKEANAPTKVSMAGKGGRTRVCTIERTTNAAGLKTCWGGLKRETQHWKRRIGGPLTGSTSRSLNKEK